MNEKLYHGSRFQGLKELAPFQSTQPGQYVYATPSEEIAAVFSIRPTGGSLTMDISIVKENNRDVLCICERKEGIFDSYKFPASIYEVDPTNFEYFEVNNWGKNELRALGTQKIIKEHRYENMYLKLQELEQEGKLVIIHYPNKTSHMANDDSDLVKKAFKLYQIGNKNFERLKQFKELYPQFTTIVDNLYEQSKNLPDEELMNFIENIYNEQNKCLIKSNI